MDKYEVLKCYLLDRKNFLETVVGNLEANGISDEKYESALWEYREIEKHINELEGIEGKRKC